MNNRELLVGAGIGAALVYMLDPVAGGRRRALLRDKAAWISRKSREGLAGQTRDLANRARGLSAKTRARLADEPVEDRTLIERVRSELGRVCSHPRAIDVLSINGDVTLRGPLLARDLDAVLAAIAAVRGVRSVVNQLEVHASGDRVPSLQREGRVAKSIIPVPRSWLPRMKSTVLGAAGLAAAGVYLASYGRSSR